MDLFSKDPKPGVNQTSVMALENNEKMGKKQGESLKRYSRDDYVRDSSDMWERRCVVPVISVWQTVLVFVSPAGFVLIPKAERILKWLPENLVGMCPPLTVRSHLKTLFPGSWCSEFMVFFLLLGFSKLFLISGSLYLQFPQLFTWLLPCCPSGVHVTSSEKPFLISHLKLPSMPP